MLTESTKYLHIREDEQERIRNDMDDHRIYWGFNQKFKQYEVWYKPDMSRPYMVTTAENAAHAVLQLRERMKYEKMRARDLIAQIDARNEARAEYDGKEALYEARNTLKGVASGRKIFTPPTTLGKAYANLSN